MGDDLIFVVQHLSSWTYRALTSVNVPGFDVSAWSLFLSLFAFSFALKAWDKLSGRHSGFDNENNNSRIYRNG